MQQAAIYVRDPLIIPGSIISKEVKERRKTVKGVWLRDDVTGQLWHPLQEKAGLARGTPRGPRAIRPAGNHSNSTSAPPWPRTGPTPHPPPGIPGMAGPSPRVCPSTSTAKSHRAKTARDIRLHRLTMEPSGSGPRADCLPCRSFHPLIRHRHRARWLVAG